jgi:hypothetical protein
MRKKPKKVWPEAAASPLSGVTSCGTGQGPAGQGGPPRGLLNLSTKAVDRLRARGLIEAVRIRSRVLFRPEAVAEFLTKSSTK